MSKKPKFAPRVQPTFKECVARALAPVLWTLAHQHLRENGHDVREDMDLLVTRCLRDAVKDLDPVTRNVVLDTTAEEASKMLRAANCDHSAGLWVALAHATLAAAERGVAFHENILLIATAVETELAEFDDEFGGIKKVRRDAILIDNVGWAEGWWRGPHENFTHTA